MLKENIRKLEKESSQLQQEHRKATQLWFVACDLTERMVAKVANNPLQSGYFSREYRALEKQKTKETYKEETDYTEYLSNVQEMLTFMEELCSKVNSQQKVIDTHEDFKKKMLAVIDNVNSKLAKCSRQEDMATVSLDDSTQHLLSVIQAGIDAVWDELEDTMHWKENLMQQVQDLTKQLKV